MQQSLRSCFKTTSTRAKGYIPGRISENVIGERQGKSIALAGRRFVARVICSACGPPKTHPIDTASLDRPSTS